eukprot:PITA_14678
MSLDLTMAEQDVMDCLQGKIFEPPSNASAATKTKYKKGEIKAKKIIRDSIHKHLVAYISDLNTSKEIYDRLVGMFKASNANQALFLKNKLKDIKKGRGEDIQSYFMRNTEIKNDLISIAEAIVDRELTPISLGGLPREWHVFNTTILNNDRIPGFEELLTRCSQEETRMMELDMPSNRNDPTAFSAHAKKKNNAGSKKQCQGRDTPHDDDNHNNNNFRGNNQRHGRFNNRGRRNAPTPHQGNGLPPKRSRNTKYDESNVVDNKQKEFYLIFAPSTASLLDTLGNWLIDSGASRKFTGYKEALSNLIEKDINLIIILADNATYPVKRVGNVTLQLNQGNTIHLQEVLYVPDLKKNLVSISAMENKGFKVAFIDGKVHVWNKNFKDAFTLGFKVDSLYQVEEVHWELCLATHHFNLNYHTGVNSLGGYLYYAIFMDDFSRKTWIYFLKKKDEVCSWFRSFKALVENQTGKKIKILRTDNGTEYESNEFNNYCREVGIKRETTIAYTPKKNGVVERKNHSIVEATRGMLHDQILLKFLWAEDANTVVYVQNKCPHQALDSKTPEEVFTGKKPDVSHFRNFGSPIYFHVPKEKRRKLDASRKKVTLVGYSETFKAYRIYVPCQREVEISHDVTFDEDAALGKISNLPLPRKDKEVDSGKQGEPSDEPMPNVEKPMDPIDRPPHESSSSKRRPSWLRETFEDADKHVAPRGTFRENKKPNWYQGYLTAMSTIVQSEPGTFEEAVKNQV